jgi:hypothetical protein
MNHSSSAAAISSNSTLEDYFKNPAVGQANVFHTSEMHLRAEALLAGIAETAFGAGCENESAGHCLPSLLAFEFGKPFSHLFGSEPLEVVLRAGGEGLQSSATCFFVWQ